MTKKLTFTEAYGALCEEYKKSYMPMISFCGAMVREAIIDGKQVTAGMIEIDLPEEATKSTKSTKK